MTTARTFTVHVFRRPDKHAPPTMRPTAAGTLTVPLVGPSETGDQMLTAVKQAAAEHLRTVPAQVSAALTQDKSFVAYGPPAQ